MLVHLDNECFPLESVKAVNLNGYWYDPQFMPIGIIESADRVWLKTDLIWSRTTGGYSDAVDAELPSIVRSWTWPPEKPLPLVTVTANMTTDKPTPQFKYNEDNLIKEFDEYVRNTYTQHYVGEDNVQSLDLIFATGHGKGFCTGNIIKYGARAGKKAGQERADLMKVLHYALLEMYLIDKEESKKNAQV